MKGEALGYYTKYTLEFERCPEPKRNGLIEALESENSMSGYGTLAKICYNQTDDIKWYNHEDDMKSISLRFPRVLFILKGEGEDTGDIWIKYFLNGKMQYAPGEIKYPKFDRKKLE